MAYGKKPATYEDLEALPVGWIGELVEDELVAQPRPAMGHQHVAWTLSILLGRTVGEGTGERGGWRLYYEPELHLGRDVLVPDLAGWRVERMPRLPGPTEPYLRLPPDWVCEVLSPSTAAMDRGRKMAVYHREGVRHVWLIDPLERTLEVYARDDVGWELAGGFEDNALVRVEPFDEVPLELGTLWLPRSGAAAPEP